MRTSIRSVVLLIPILLASLQPAVAQHFTLEDRLSKAIDSIADGHYVEATEILTELVEEDHLRPELHHLLGVTYLRLSDLDKAEYFLQLAVNLEPEDADFRYDLALVHYRGVRYDRTIVVLDQAIKLADGRSLPRFQRLRGLAYARKRNWSATIKNLKPAMKREPDAGSLIQLGRAYMGTGNDRKAVEAFRRAQTLDPTHGESYRLASESLVRIAQKTDNAKRKREVYGEALEEAESLLSVRPMSWRSWYQAGRAAIGAQEMDKAEDYLRQVVAERPDYCFAWLNLARIYQDAERTDEAIEAIDEAEACAPELAPTLDLDDLDRTDDMEERVVAERR